MARTFSFCGFNTMKKLLLAFASVAVATFSSAQSADARFRFAAYVQPSVVVAFPGDFDTAAGAAISIGTTINEVHAVEAEVIYFKSEDAGVNVKFLPLLASYKYHWSPNAKWTIRAGGSVGATRIESEGFWWPGWYSGMNGRWMDRGSEMAFTAGVNAGASYAVTQRVSLEADVLVLGLNETDYTSSGSITLVTLGVKYRF